MKKLLAVCIAGVLAVTAHAQVSFGIHADGIYSFGKITVQNEPDYKSEPAFSFKAGALVDIPLAKTISFMPELNAAVRTTKFSDETGTTKDEATLSPLFLEIPLNMAYKGSLKKGAFFIGAGPVLSIGLGGKYKGTSTYYEAGQLRTISRDLDIKFDDDDAANDDDLHLKKFEFGIDVFVGYQAHTGFFVRALFMQGLSNLNVLEGNGYKSGYAGIGIGYFFKGKKK